MHDTDNDGTKIILGTVNDDDDDTHLPLNHNISKLNTNGDSSSHSQQEQEQHEQDHQQQQSSWVVEGVRRIRNDHVQRNMTYITGMAAIGVFLFGYDTGTYIF